MDVRAFTDAGDDGLLGLTVSGRFTVLSKLGAGSMGTVYRARQEGTHRDVALKILRGERAYDASAKARFEREARANSLLTSPYTVTVFDFGVAEDGSPFIAMELLEGESLGHRLRRENNLHPQEAVRFAREALMSLAEAHTKGIIHRDIKPDNLFLARIASQDQNSTVELCKVLDFGIAKLVREDGGIDSLQTQAGTVFGTPRYMSPEQAQGKTLDARSDLYSLAIILYQMLVGRPPFEDEDAVLVMARSHQVGPPLPGNLPPDPRLAGARAGRAAGPLQEPRRAPQLCRAVHPAPRRGPRRGRQRERRPPRRRPAPVAHPDPCRVLRGARAAPHRGGLRLVAFPLGAPGRGPGADLRGPLLLALRAGPLGQRSGKAGGFFHLQPPFGQRTAPEEDR